MSRRSFILRAVGAALSLIGWSGQAAHARTRSTALTILHTNEDPKLKVGGMIQVSGVRFRYDPSRENGRRVANIEPSEGK